MANNCRKGNLTEDLILHAFTLLPGLKIERFYWLRVQQSESLRGKPFSACFMLLIQSIFVCQMNEPSDIDLSYSGMVFIVRFQINDTERIP